MVHVLTLLLLLAIAAYDDVACALDTARYVYPHFAAPRGRQTVEEHLVGRYRAVLCRRRIRVQGAPGSPPRPPVRRREEPLPVPENACQAFPLDLL